MRKPANSVLQAFSGIMILEIIDTYFYLNGASPKFTFIDTEA